MKSASSPTQYFIMQNFKHTTAENFQRTSTTKTVINISLDLFYHTPSHVCIFLFIHEAILKKKKSIKERFFKKLHPAVPRQVFQFNNYLNIYFVPGTMLGDTIGRNTVSILKIFKIWHIQETGYQIPSLPPSSWHNKRSSGWPKAEESELSRFVGSRKASRRKWHFKGDFIIVCLNTETQCNVHVK